MKKLFLILLLGIFLISFTSASILDSKKIIDTKTEAFTLDEKVIPYNDLWIKYKPLEINNLFGKTKFSGAITQHTESCGINCFSTMEIYTSGDDALIDDVIFKTLQDDGSWIEQNIRSYQFYVRTGGTQILVDDYKTICEDKISLNGTTYSECNRIKSGSHYEESPEWTQFNLGDKFKEGTYTIKLEGQKKPSRTVDWQIVTSGKILDEWAVWGGIGHDLLTYYSFEETSGNVIDLTGNGNNGTVVGTVQRNVTGKINKGYNFTGSGYINITNTNYNLTEGFSVNMWINNSNTSNKKQGEYIFQHGDISVHIYSYDSNNRIRFNFNLFTGVSIYTNVTWTGEFVFISFGLDNETKNPFACVNTDCYISSYNYTPYTGYEEPQQTSLGGSSFGNWKGLIDEFSIFDKALSESEILELYNSGNGYNPVITGRVSLNSPADDSIQLTNLVTTNSTATVTGGATLKNVTLYDNSTGTWGARNTSSFKNMIEGLSGDLIDNVNDFVSPTQARFGVGPNPVTLYIKYSYNDGTDWTGSNIQYANGNYLVNISNNYPERLVTNITAWVTGTGGVLYSSPPLTTWTIEPSNATQTFTNTYSAGSNTLWNMQFCDSDGDCGFATSNYTFSIDTTAPTIDLISPNSTYNYLKQGDTLYLSGFANDSNLDTVWYEYNGTNTTFSASNATLFNESITQADSSKLSLTLWANDTIGNTNREVISWDYKVFENDRIYSLNAYETEMKDFIINLTYNSSTFVPTVYLNYDGTNYSTINIGSGNEGKFKNTVSIGLIDGSTSKEFYWWILANDSVIKTESNNQTINNLIFQICNGTYTNKTLNFKFYDESKNTLLNSTLNPLTFETYFEFWVGKGDIKKSYNYNVQNTTTGSYDFCISPANFSFNSNLQISYSAEDYSKRESSYNELNLTNIIQNISFYLLPTELSTKFTHYVRQEIEALAGVSVEVYKFLISTGNYTLISTKTTDENGRFVEWLELDQKYKYTVKSEGISLTEQEKQAICAVSPCEITLQIDEVSLNAFNELNAYFAQNVDYNLTYNKSTSTFKLSFLDLTGTANYWRLYVYKSNSNNDTLNSICNLYAYSSSGELECDTSLYFGEITAKVYISRSPEKLVDFLIRVNENITPVLSVSGLLASIIILLVIIFTGTRNPTSALLMLPFGLIILKFIGFMPLTWGWIAGITIFILAISYKMNT